MATGTQMVLEVKKNKLNNSSKWFTSVSYTHLTLPTICSV